MLSPNDEHSIVDQHGFRDKWAVIVHPAVEVVAAPPALLAGVRMVVPVCSINCRLDMFQQLRLGLIERNDPGDFVPLFRRWVQIWVPIYAFR